MPSHEGLYLWRHGRKLGPLSLSDLQELADAGQIGAGDRVWHDQSQSWLPFAQHPELSENPAAPSTSQSAAQRARKSSVLQRTAGAAVLHYPFGFLLPLQKLLSDPERFAKSQIDVGPGCLRRSIYFYLNVFGLVFLALSSLSYLAFCEGSSQVRELALLLVQLLMAFPILYALARLARMEVSFSGVVQSTLYIDAAFLLVNAAFTAAMSFYLYLQATGGTLDVIGTEYERCLASHSLIYSLLKGGLTLYRHDYNSDFATAIKAWAPFGQFVIVLPFCYLYGLLLKYRYGVSGVLNFGFAVLTFVTVVIGVAILFELCVAWSTQGSDCHNRTAKQLTQKYNRALLASAAADRINYQIKSAGGRQVGAVGVRGDTLFMGWRMAEPKSSERQETILSAARELYCSNSVDFTVLRELGVSMLVAISDFDGTKLRQERVAPDQCTT